MQPKKTPHEEIDNLVYRADLENTAVPQLERNKIKNHKNLLHKSAEPIISRFQMAGK